jgi:hypothetical protein
VFLGRGDGTFSTVHRYAVGSEPNSILVGDFNGDGIPDVIVGNLYFPALTLLVGRGDGSFLAAVQVAATTSPPPPNLSTTPVVAADLNVDGFLDLAFPSETGSGFWLMPGHGNGTFDHASIVYPTGGVNAIAVADFNRDGLTDAVVVSNPLVHVLLSSGNGVFVEQPGIICGSDNLNFVKALDINGDGFVDIVAGGRTTLGFTYSVVLGRGDGTFDSAVDVPWPGPTQVFGSPVVIADFNNDGISDAATASGSNYISVMLGTGAIAYGPALTIPVGNNSLSVIAGDFNRDGRIDLAVTNYQDNTVDILINGACASGTP